jgi:hypothetical protein
MTVLKHCLCFRSSSLFSSGNHWILSWILWYRYYDHSHFTGGETGYERWNNLPKIPNHEAGFCPRRWGYRPNFLITALYTHHYPGDSRSILKNPLPPHYSYMYVFWHLNLVISYTLPLHHGFTLIHHMQTAHPHVHTHMHTGHVLEFSPLEKSKETRINDVSPLPGLSYLRKHCSLAIQILAGLHGALLGPTLLWPCLLPVACCVPVIVEPSSALPLLLFSCSSCSASQKPLQFPVLDFNHPQLSESQTKNRFFPLT